ncbi:MAG: hypothetical protein M1827_000810 [Pycnora praestabilis]|nr:MAG: hypothetical protein M1827_000810 [Pycnora praestabilis]
MKILTVNFLTCAVKACKSSPLSFPLHFKDAELVQQEMDFNPDFVRNILPRVDWDGLRVTAGEVLLNPTSDFLFPRLAVDKAPELTIPPGGEQLGFTTIPTEKPEGEALADDQVLGELHKLLLETQVMEGKLVCGNCRHEYAIKEGIANFLLPNHLGLGWADR